MHETAKDLRRALVAADGVGKVEIAGVQEERILVEVDQAQLAAAGTMTMGDLAALLRVRPPTASKTVTRLAALGIVERRAESGDGRVVRVQLTEAGMAKAEAIERIQEEVEAELLDHLDKTDRRRLRKLLRKAARGLAEAAGASGQTTEADAEIEAEDEAEALAT
ncbi:MarR family transcriptional regulator [Methylobacterium organophilum]|nr:MarR family transcriptional regulator [Methylobacterium organophilum]